MNVPFSRYGKCTFCLIALALIAISCSSKKKYELLPVRGKVLVNDKPAKGVLVMFLPAVEGPDAPHPVATTAEDGTFALVTDEDDGAPAGDYIVTMQWLKEAPAPNSKKGEAISMRMSGDPVDDLKGKYIERKNGIKVKIQKGVEEVPPFKLQK
jgi:hypothetical protein